MQFGLVYGFVTQPTNVIQSSDGKFFQFLVTDASGNTTLYNIQYTAGTNANLIKVDVPSLLPSFTQAAPFTFVVSDPLTFETGGYNAFITAIVETAVPTESYAAAYKTPVVSTDSQLDNLIGTQGDFSVEFWHSLPITPTEAYHPFTYSASTSKLTHLLRRRRLRKCHRHLRADQQHRAARHDRRAHDLVRLAPLRACLRAALHHALQRRRV